MFRAFAFHLSKLPQVCEVTYRAVQCSNYLDSLSKGLETFSPCFVYKYQGCHYLPNVKSRYFSMTFQDLFGQIKDFLYELKLECNTLFFK